MILKEAEYSKCGECGRRKELVSQEVWCCDKCKTEVSSPHDEERTYLSLKVFYNDNKNQHLQFCSWKCVFDFLKTIQRTKNKCDYFVDLPSIFFDDMKPGYKDFMNALKNS